MATNAIIKENIYLPYSGERNKEGYNAYTNWVASPWAPFDGVDPIQCPTGTIYFYMNTYRVMYITTLKVKSVCYITRYSRHKLYSFIYLSCISSISTLFIVLLGSFHGHVFDL